MVDHHSLALLHGHVLYCHPIAPSPRLCNAKLCNYTCLRGQACAALPEMFFFSHPPFFKQLNLMHIGSRGCFLLCC